jgi:hypothetical protein
MKTPTCTICNGKGYVLAPGHPKTFCLCTAADPAWATFLVDGAKGDFQFPFALRPSDANEASFKK